MDPSPEWGGGGGADWRTEARGGAWEVDQSAPPLLVWRTNREWS